MAFDTLTNMISALEYGTNLHICVVFLKHYGNDKTSLPHEQKIHTCPICDAAKASMDGFASCFRCRNTVLKWCIRHKRSIGGLCSKGVYEYCRPIVRNNDVPAVIFVGNILTDDKHQHYILQKQFGIALLDTMQPDVSQKTCVQIADVLESYILFLMEQYGDTPSQPADALIENIKGYITENLLYDFSLADLAAVFNYNEKYLGRLFKTKAGCTIREYGNTVKIEKAKRLLIDSHISIADIATRTGFNNVTYFNRVFKKCVQLSPQAYRKAQQALLQEKA